MQDHEALVKTIKEGKRLVVFLHDNPDPDSIASGWLLYQLAKHIGVKARIIYGGRTGRAENRAMIDLLKIPVHCLQCTKKPIRFLKTDRYALVDTQPGTGNNSFPVERMRCHIVIDHHPNRNNLDSDYIDIRPEHGCCATMLLGYHRALSLTPSADLATAVAYAIISETQDLGREATRQDREALQSLMPVVRLPILGKIRHPPRQRDYYRTIARAMQNVLLSQNTCVCHIGQVHMPEVVAEVADFLVSMERVTWCLTTGFYGKCTVVSLRTTHRRAKTERIIRRAIGKKGTGGGHGMTGGGTLPCQTIEEYQEHGEYLTKRFIKQLKHKHPDVLRPLITNEPPSNKS